MKNEIKLLHTPGTWEVHTNEKLEKTSRLAITADKAKKVNGHSLFVASVHYEKAWQDKFVANMGRKEEDVRRFKEEAEANAKLIAKAPQMLDLLLKIHKQCVRAQYINKTVDAFNIGCQVEDVVEDLLNLKEFKS